MSEYQHITERPKHILEETMDYRYTHHISSNCSCSCCKNSTRPYGYYTQIAKVEGEGNFHKAMEILGNETQNNNWKDIHIFCEVGGIQGNWVNSVKASSTWVVVGFDTKFYNDTKLTGRKVINYVMD